MIAGFLEAHCPSALALAVVVSLSACTDSVAAQDRSDVAMFRGNAARTGVYAASPGQSLAGLQWRFMTEGEL